MMRHSLERIEQVLQNLQPRPKLILFNYPHNPTAITIEPEFWEKAVALAKKYGVLVISDFAYGETCFGGYQAPSFLATAGAKEVGVEFSTMSKPYNMAGWRVGFCCGNAEMVRALSTIKGYYDYGHFAPIQIAGIMALRHGDDFVKKQCAIYEARRDILVKGLRKIGWDVETPRASMFVWAKVAEQPSGETGHAGFLLPPAGRGGRGDRPGGRLRAQRRRLRAHRPGGKRAADQAGVAADGCGTQRQEEAPASDQSSAIGQRPGAARGSDARRSGCVHYRWVSGLALRRQCESRRDVMERAGMKPSGGPGGVTWGAVLRVNDCPRKCGWRASR